MGHAHDKPPEVLEAHWDHERVYKLFEDLRRVADVKHVQVRTSHGVPPRDSAVTLEQARQLLDEGAAKAIQIRYEFDGQSWCDTLTILPETIRVVRTSGMHLPLDLNQD